MSSVRREQKCRVTYRRRRYRASVSVFVPLLLKKPTLVSIGATSKAFGGVTQETFENLFRTSLTDLFARLGEWEGPDALSKLWLAVYDTEHILMSRLRNLAGGSARVLGYSSGYREEPPELDASMFDSDTEEELSDSSVSSIADESLPNSLAESILSFLAAGFSPLTTPPLKSKLESLIKIAIDEHLGRFRVAIPYSLEGFAVPGM